MSSSLIVKGARFAGNTVADGLRIASHYTSEDNRGAIRDFAAWLDRAVDGASRTAVEQSAAQLNYTSDFLMEVATLIQDDAEEADFDQTLSKERCDTFSRAEITAGYLAIFQSKQGAPIITSLQRLLFFRKLGNGDWLLALAWQARLGNWNNVKRYIEEKVGATAQAKLAQAASREERSYYLSLMSNWASSATVLTNELCRLAMSFNVGLLERVKEIEIRPPSKCSPAALYQWVSVHRIAKKAGTSVGSFQLRRLRDLSAIGGRLASIVSAHEGTRSGSLPEEHLGRIGLAPTRDTLLSVLSFVAFENEKTAEDIERDIQKARDIISDKNLCQSLLVKGLRCYTSRKGQAKDSVTGELVSVTMTSVDILHPSAIGAILVDDANYFVPKFMQRGEGRDRDLVALILLVSVLLESIASDAFMVKSSETLPYLVIQSITFREQVEAFAEVINISQLTAAFACALDPAIRPVAPHIERNATGIVGLQGEYGIALLVNIGASLRDRFQWRYTFQGINDETPGEIFMPSQAAKPSQLPQQRPSQVRRRSMNESSISECLAYIYKEKPSSALKFSILPSLGFRSVNYGWCVDKISQFTIPHCEHADDDVPGEAFSCNAIDCLELALENQQVALGNHPIWFEVQDSLIMQIFACGLMPKNAKAVYQGDACCRCTAVQAGSNSCVIPSSRSSNLLFVQNNTARTL